MIEIRTVATIWYMWLRSVRLVRATATADWAITATAPTKAVIRGPANDAVTAGAAIRNGPIWTSGGTRTSTTVTTAINAKGTTSSSLPPRRDRCGAKTRRPGPM